MAAKQGPGRAEEEQLLWPGGGNASHSCYTAYSVPPHLPGAGKGNPHPLTRHSLTAQWPSPSHLSVHRIVTVLPDVFFFLLGLKGVLLTLFTLIYYHSHFSGSHNWCQGLVCA